ncbi:hypothetical protein BGX27_001940 [Mortierella sp. AM989]|nr:hypothetical protein BGX27_001940 [Mortierella sp. AM989]
MSGRLISRTVWTRRQQSTDDVVFEAVDVPKKLRELSEFAIIDHIHGDGDGSGRVSTVRSIFRRKKEDMIQIKNETDTTICIVCTQDLVSVLDNGGAGLNAGAAGVDLRLDIAKALVGVKEIKSVLKLGPNESQNVLAASKYATVSVFNVDGDTMKLLFKSALLKRGRRLIVEQRDVKYALNDHELVILDQ